MKHIYLHLIALLIATTSFSQTTYTWIGPNNGSWGTSSNWSPVRSSASPSDILQFNDGTTKTISSVPTQTIGRLSISNNTGVTLNSSSNNRTLTIGNSTGNDLIVMAGSTLTIGPANSNFTISLAANGDADISGTLIVNSSHTYNTNASGVNTTVASGGLIQNSGTVSCSNSSKLTVSAGGAYMHAENGGAIPTASWNASSDIQVTGITNSIPSGLSQSFGNFTWDCAGQTSNINMNGALTTVNGNFTVANTGTGRILLGSNDMVTLNVGGDITVGSAGNTAILDMDSNNGVITINFPGNLVTLGSGQIDNSGNYNASFNFNSNSGTQYINLGNPSSFVANWGGNLNFGNGSTSNTVVLQTDLALAPFYLTNIVVSGGSTFDMAGFAVTDKGTFTVNSGSVLAIGDAAGITNSGSTGNVQVSSTRSYSSGADYIYKGTSAQVTGSGLPSTVNRLIINNTSGVNTGAGVTLTQSTAVSTELVLTNGFLKSSAANMITVNAGASATATNNSFVDGPIRKTGNTNFTFPTGWSGISGGRIPISVSSLSASATIQAEYKRLPALSVGATLTAPLNHVSYCEYWELFPTAGSVNATITMNWNAYSNCSPAAYVNDFSTLRVARSNGSAWTSVGNTGGSLGSGTVISNANTTINNSTPFKYFTLASTNSATNPLPVFFTEVRAYEKDNGVEVEWTNLTEKDIQYYTVQRSANGRDFTDIYSRLPVSNQGDRAAYNSFDATPVQAVNYYRIKALETTGNTIYTKILRIEIGKNKTGLSVYPNPVVSKELTFSLNNVSKGNYHLTLINNTGQQVYDKMIQVQGTIFTQTLLLPASIRPGVYSLLINGTEYRGSQLFVVE